MGSARMQPNSFEQLRSSFESASWTHDFLADYVNEVGRQAREEDIFQQMAFRCATGAGSGVTGALEDVSRLYQAMTPEAQKELRRWWHDKAHREAYRYDDLRTRLSWRFFV
jgi:hypothetical protein